MKKSFWDGYKNMSIDLCDIVNKIKSYSDILKKYNYNHNPDGGIKPWSNLYENYNGTRVEIRSSEWTYYDKENNEKKVDYTPESLDEFLKEKYGNLTSNLDNN